MRKAMTVSEIPDGCKAKILEIYYDRGCIVTDYKVLVPDSTISGDFRLEYVTVRQPVSEV